MECLQTFPVEDREGAGGMSVTDVTEVIVLVTSEWNYLRVVSTDELNLRILPSTAFVPPLYPRLGFENELVDLFFYGWSGTSPPVLWPFIGVLYQPWMIDGDDCGAVSGMKEWQGKQKSLDNGV
jgi:hypothetical protein